MSAKKGFKRKSGASSDIPSSSMADIAFLLLIFFMVSTVFRKDVSDIVSTRLALTGKLMFWVMMLMVPMALLIGVLAHAVPVVAQTESEDDATDSADAATRDDGEWDQKVACWALTEMPSPSSTLMRWS